MSRLGVRYDQGIHIVPVNDLREHDTLHPCWCRPRPDDEHEELIIHNAMDQREQYENGRKPQ